MVTALETGRLYQLADGTKVTFVQCEQHGKPGAPETVARVILATGYNPTEAEPVTVLFVQPDALQTIQVGNQKNTMAELTPPPGLSPEQDKKWREADQRRRALKSHLIIQRITTQTEGGHTTSRVEVTKTTPKLPPR